MRYYAVAANIVADAIIALSRDVGGFMNDDSVYIMSGIIDTRADEVEQAVTKRFEIIDKYEENGWVCLVAKKK